MCPFCPYCPGDVSKKQMVHFHVVLFIVSTYSSFAIKIPRHSPRVFFYRVDNELDSKGR